MVGGVVYAGSEDGKVYALDAADGSELWSFPTGGSCSVGAVVDGVVYAGSADHKVYALDAADGSEIWSYTGGRGREEYNAINEPVVVGGVVYVGAEDGKASCPPHTACTFKLSALDAADGSELWSSAYFDSPVTSPPAVVGGVVYLRATFGASPSVVQSSSRYVCSTD